MNDLRRDDRAAMMMLIAIILLIGFVALAGMVARVAQIPEQSALERQDLFLDEAARVASAVQEAIGIAQSDPDPVAVLNGTLSHLQHVEAGRGYVFSFSIAPDLRVEARLADASSSLVMDIGPP